MNEPPKAEPRKAVSWRYVAAGLLLAVLAIWLLTHRAKPSPGGRDANDPAVRELEAAHRDELFDYAIDSINRQEEFNTGEMLKQAVDRLDNWVRDQEPPASWRVDPMVATLPEPLQKLPVVTGLDKMAFTLDPPNSDGWAFQEAVWLRDLSNWARGEEVGDLPRAGHLFDWTVRNVQLDKQPPEQAEGPPTRVLQKPWETLMLGHGTAEERAWVFILLARNQGLDAAMIGPADAPEGESPDRAARLVGVLSGDQLYLFDPELGLPVPAPDGPKLDDAGRLVVQPASLAQVVSDDGLLRRFDADPDHPYPLHAADLDGAVAWLEASPSYLSQRMKLVESRLAGDDRLVLTADPTAQAERIKRCPQVADVRLWTLPYRAALLEMRYQQERERWQFYALMPFQVGVELSDALWRGRSYQLKGRLVGTPSATEYYQMARPSDRQIDALTADDQIKRVLLLGKLDASYWLGLVAARQGNDRSARDYLDTRMLQVTMKTPWLHGAVYNLARMFEASDVKKAIGLYRTDADSPAYHGNLLRAKWLESLTGVKVDNPLRDQAPRQTTPKSHAEGDGRPGTPEP